MVHPSWRVLMVGLLLGGLAVGCKSQPIVQHKQPPDPLLVTTKYQEGRSGAEMPEATVRIDPLPPAMPIRERTATLPGRIDVTAADRPEVRLGAPVR